jgi:hypothetical protein
MLRLLPIASIVLIFRVYHVLPDRHFRSTGLISSFGLSRYLDT